MAVEVYLGNPPENIRLWIINNSQYASHSDTRFTLANGTTESYEITGTLNYQWMCDNGFYDETNWSWMKPIVEANLGNTLTSVSDSAFYECSSLTNVIIPESITTIGINVFDTCIGLTSIIIPNSVSSIGDTAFYNCSSFISMIIPNNVMSIGYRAFENCSNLTSVVFEGKTLTQVQNMNNYPWDIEPTTIISVA